MNPTRTLAAVLAAATAVVALSGCVAADSGSDGAQASTNKTKTAGEKAKSKPAAPKFTVAQENAIKSAEAYLNLGSGFSRAGMIQQLTSQAADGYKMPDAVFAVDHIKVDWNKQAVLAAKGYLAISGFSRASLIQQLTSTAGSQFTPAQAAYAANHVGL